MSQRRQESGRTADVPRQAIWVVALPLLTLLVLYWVTFADMAAIWLRSQTFAHGLVIFPVSAFLIWRKRAVLRTVVLHPDPLGLVVLGGLCSVWAVAALVDVRVVQHLAVVSMVPALVLTVLGRAWVRAIAFPLAFLFFAAPFGEGLIPYLMRFTAAFTIAALRLSGIPVYSEGFYFSIPSGDFEVAVACSGIRYLIASLALGSLYAYLTYHSRWRRAAFITLSIVVPVVANGLRAYGIVLLAHLSDMKLAKGVDHLIYGWLFFGMVMFALFWFGARFRDEAPPPASSDLRSEASYPPRLGVPLAALTSVLLLAAGAVSARLLGGGAVGVPGLAVPALPRAPAGWNGPLLAQADFRPRFLRADVEIAGRYTQGARSLDLFVFHYAGGPDGAELTAWGNRIADEQVWLPTGESAATLEIPGRVLRYAETSIRSNTRNRLVWHWYLVGDQPARSVAAVKLREVYATLTRRQTGSTLIALSVPYDTVAGEARETLGTFLAAAGAALEQCAAGAGAQPGSCSAPR